MTNKHSEYIPPAQLWIGPHNHLCSQAEQFLQHKFCKNDACSTCTTCRLIREHQYHNATWLRPEKRYTREQIQIIFETISLALAPEQHYFFIIQKADFLTPACANSLLKSVEEPPHGYHFIFLAERKDIILPTIRSRCIINTFQAEQSEHEKEQLLTYFKTSPSDPLQFAQILGKIKPNEQESIELLDKLFTQWMTQLKKATIEQNKTICRKAEGVISILKTALQKPPMPGSSTIFWKNLYLKINQ